MKREVFLALGSNLGDRESYLIEAVKNISCIPHTKVTAVSSIYETEPVGFKEQDRFLNMAAKIDTELEPLELLERLQSIENSLNRVRQLRWGPRTIDIDILLYDDMRMNLTQLEIPHPRMFERAFVLIPLRDIYSPDANSKLDFEVLIGKCSDNNGIKLYRQLTMDSIHLRS